MLFASMNLGLEFQVIMQHPIYDMQVKESLYIG